MLLSTFARSNLIKKRLRKINPSPINNLEMFLVLLIKCKIKPKTRKTKQYLSMLRPVIKDVNVVPMFEPIIIDIAFFSLSLLAFNKEITIAVTADDDWVKNVIMIPTRKDIKILEVNLFNIYVDFELNLLSK